MYLWYSLWDWIQANATVFSALTSVGMLIIWGVYLQLLLHNFRMQRRPQIIINRGHGRDLDSRCLVSNMSQSSVFVETVIACLITNKNSYCRDITDEVNEAGNEDERLRELSQAERQSGRWTRQGPLDTAEYMEGGSFRSFIECICLQHDLATNDNGLPSLEEETLEAIEIRVIGFFGPDPKPIGASRRFNISVDDDSGLIRLIPATNYTPQSSKRRHRRMLRRWVNDIE
ncbi:hypothetical protein [Larsenimonas rhizosphaerae]|uniref:hypothetical protein n=1 Tax=Larsenimonas rhizosphaerae TaxID=2944682 RepID=UPI00203330B4|nr:hypothetical protein [Larsenimonas rhizosphaerae]MCM2130272.1 hypothetical protein [Larsenimonas rhizosphaerae]